MNSVAYFPTPNRTLVSPSLVLPELRGKTFVTYRNKGKENDSLRSANLPSPTVWTGMVYKGRIPVNDLNVLKRLQSFPKTFKVSSKQVIVNAVPPNLMCAIANTIKVTILNK